MTESYSKLIDMAYNLHTSGKYSEAQVLYEKLLALYPENPDLLNLYAQLNISLSNYDLAIEYYNKAYSLTKIDSLKISIIRIFISKRDFVSVTKEVDFLIQKESDIFDSLTLSDLFNISFSYHQIGDIDTSLDFSLFAFSKYPQDSDLILHISRLYEEKGLLVETIKYLELLLNLQKDVSIICRVASLYKQLNDTENSIIYFKKALEIDEYNKIALINLAILYSYIDKNISLLYLNKILEKYDNDEKTLNYLCSLLLQMNKNDTANVVAKKLYNINPNNHSYCLNYANTSMLLFNYDKAVELYKKAFSINNSDFYPLTQIAYIYSFIGKANESIEILNSIPDKDLILEDFAYINCRERNLEDAREEFFKCHTNSVSAKDKSDSILSFFYKYGYDKKYGINEQELIAMQDKFFNKSRNKLDFLAKKMWKGQDISGKKLIVYSAHGVGDIFMMLRYIKELASIVSELILFVPKSCIDIIKFNFNNLRVVSTLDEISEYEYDYSSSFLTLLYNMNKSLKTIEFSYGYLSVPDNLVEKKSILDIFRTDKLKVGFYWQGNPTILANRSIPVEKLKPIIELDNVQAYSFQISQVDYESDDLKKDLPLIDLAPSIQSYMDTALFLKNIDILVTIDTSIAHLAGAMGVKTYLLLPFESEWRWFHDTEKTPWYDSVTIYKQIRPSVWDDVVERIVDDIKV